MAKHRVKKSFASSPSFRKAYGVSQKAPKKVSRKKVFVKI
jgi:hypothetical protein